MKKWGYLLSGVVLGAALMVSSSAFADQIKTLIGKSVAGEYTVTVDGKTLSEKAIVVDNKAHVPLRAVSDSLGARIKVEGKTIEVITASSPIIEENTVVSSDMPIAQIQAKSRDELLESKYILINKAINPSEARREVLTKQIADSKVQLAEVEKTIQEAEQKGFPEYEKTTAQDVKSWLEASLAKNEAELKTLEDNLIKYNAQLKEVEEALKTAK
jgi:hypothetical protein